MSYVMNDEYSATDGSMLCSLPGFCVMYSVNCFANDWWFSYDQVIIWMCLSAKQHTAI